MRRTAIAVPAGVKGVQRSAACAHLSASAVWLKWGPCTVAHLNGSGRQNIGMNWRCSFNEGRQAPYPSCTPTSKKNKASQNNPATGTAACLCLQRNFSDTTNLPTPPKSMAEARSSCRFRRKNKLHSSPETRNPQCMGPSWVSLSVLDSA